MRRIALCAVIGMFGPGTAFACDDAPADCALKAGKAALAGNPDEAARQFLAAYRLEPKPSTLAGYALALQQAHHLAAAVDAYTRAKTIYAGMLADAGKAVDVARSGDAGAAATAQAAFDALREQMQGVDLQLATLASVTARIHLQYAGGVPPHGLVIQRKGQDDLANPFGGPIVVDTTDVLVVTYPDGKTKELAVTVAGGSESTVVVPAPETAVSPEPRSLETRSLETRSLETRSPEPRVSSAVPPPSPSPAVVEHGGRWLGLGLTVGGALVLGAGGALDLKARSDYQNSRCQPDGSCPDDRAIAAGRSADHLAWASLGVALGGLALATTGVIVWVRDGEARTEQTSFRLVPHAGGATAVLTGSF